MTTLEMLRGARNRISDPERWCQLALSTNGGTKYCALGALISEAISTDIHADLGQTSIYSSACTLLAIQANECVGMFNDTHTHAEVLELFDHAIARLEEHESGEKPCPISDTSTSSRPSLVPA